MRRPKYIFGCMSRFLIRQIYWTGFLSHWQCSDCGLFRMLEKPDLLVKCPCFGFTCVVQNPNIPQRAHVGAQNRAVVRNRAVLEADTTVCPGNECHSYHPRHFACEIPGQPKSRKNPVDWQFVNSLKQNQKGGFLFDANTSLPQKLFFNRWTM